MKQPQVSRNLVEKGNLPYTLTLVLRPPEYECVGCGRATSHKGFCLECAEAATRDLHR